MRRTRTRVGRESTRTERKCRRWQPLVHDHQPRPTDGLLRTDRGADSRGKVSTPLTSLATRTLHFLSPRSHLRILTSSPLIRLLFHTTDAPRIYPIPSSLSLSPLVMYRLDVVASSRHGLLPYVLGVSLHGYIPRPKFELEFSRLSMPRRLTSSLLRFLKPFSYFVSTCASIAFSCQNSPILERILQILPCPSGPLLLLTLTPTNGVRWIRTLR